VSRGIWKIVETKARKIGIAEVERERIERERERIEKRRKEEEKTKEKRKKTVKVKKVVKEWEI